MYKVVRDQTGTIIGIYETRTEADKAVQRVITGIQYIGYSYTTYSGDKIVARTRVRR